MRTAAAWAWAALAGAFASLPAGAAAQRAPAEPAPPVRLVAFVQEPREPELGEVFELTLTLRMGPGTVAFLPDTLLPAEDAASAGHATWTLGLAPADSIDVRATYPVMGFLPGGVELPTLELWARPARAGEAAGPRPASELPEAERGPDGAARRLVLPIGGALIMPPAAMQGGDDALLPEPPADVLGGEWSGWLVAAGGTLALAGALAFVFVADKLRPRRRGTPSPRAVRASAKRLALEELDRLLESGWHRDGRAVDFYDATTAVLRRLAAERDPALPVALTSSELLARLEERAGDAGTSRLGAAIRAAELAKFAGRTAGGAEAEEHWAAVRAWITGLPEA